MPFILGANETKATGFNVDNSIRFTRNDDSYLDRTFGTPTDRKKFTISFWLKRGNITVSGGTALFGSNGGNTSTFGTIHFNPHDDFCIGAANGGSDVLNLQTDRKFRDVGAWYHFCVAVDSTQATNTNRVKLYVNGIQETSFSTSTYPSENEEFLFNMATKVHSIGRFPYGSDILSIDGYLTEFVFIDGTANAVTDFGEFDEDSPTIWKAKDVSGLTFGSNGFYLDFEDSGDLGDDESGNENDFAETNVAATDQATDSCTNNFCTLNTLAFENAGGINRISEGNLRLDGGSSSAHNLSIGTIAVNKGKWWFEAELDAIGGDHPQIGIRSVDVNNTLGQYVGEVTGGVGYASNGTIAVDSSNVSTGGTTYTSGDLINVGLDLDNNKIYWYKNGSLLNSGGTTITNRRYTFAVSQYSNTGHWFCNFGESAPYTISSGNSDANGYGNFEHAPVSGYLSLCTKNLAEEG